MRRRAGQFRDWKSHSGVESETPSQDTSTVHLRAVCSTNLTIVNALQARLEWPNSQDPRPGSCRNLLHRLMAEPRTHSARVHTRVRVFVGLGGYRLHLGNRPFALFLHFDQVLLTVMVMSMRVKRSLARRRGRRHDT